MKNRASKLMVAALGVLVVGAVLWMFGGELHAAVLEAKEWVGDLGVWGWAIFVVGFIVLTSLTIPDSLLCIVAGTVFGFSGGIALILVSATIARALQYFLARRLLKSRVQGYVASRPRLTQIAQAVLGDQLRLQFLIRLTPMSFTLVSYLFGATGVRFGGYMLALCATLPLHLVMVYLGVEGAHVAEMGARPESGIGARDVLMVVGLLVSGAVLVVITRVALREVRLAAESTSNQA